MGPFLVPPVWVRPVTARGPADAAKARLDIPEGDHLSLLNVFNKYMESKFSSQSTWSLQMLTLLNQDPDDKNWAWVNFVSARTLAQARNVRAQLKAIMERLGIPLVSSSSEDTRDINIRKALTCSYFMQAAHRGKGGGYVTVKDNPVRITSTSIHPYYTHAR